MSLFISEEDLRELTGFKARAQQIRELNRMGIDHLVRADGRVLVLKTTMGVYSSPQAVHEPQIEPNWGPVDDQKIDWIELMKRDEKRQIERDRLAEKKRADKERIKRLKKAMKVRNG